MVNVSVETTEAMERRLLTVMASSRLRTFDRPYAFHEFGLASFPAAVRSDALALVRDDHRWSQVVPADPSSVEQFGLFSFHFSPDLDNSGFVGWLATSLKSRFGTGVFVICGYNASDGGIYDYWGCPMRVYDAVIEAIHELRSSRISPPLPTWAGP